MLLTQAFVEPNSCCLKRTKGVTLAICTHNGSSRLASTLRHILAQAVPSDIRWEVLVIDNASSDRTQKFVEQLWIDSVTEQSKPALRVVREEKLGAIYARQRAIQVAQYCYLSYIDDDNWISENWVSEIYRIFEEHPSVGLVSCPSSASYAKTPPAYFEGLEGWLAVGHRCLNDGIVDVRPMSFWTAGLSLRLEAFSPLEETPYVGCLIGRTGSQTYGGEDHELCLTLTLMGWDTYYTSQISFVHEIPSFRLAESYLERLIQNGGKSRVVLDIYRNEYWQRTFYSPYLSIIEYFAYFCDRALKYWLKRLLGLASAPLNPNRTAYLHAMGRVQSYFIHFKKIAQAKRNIKILKALQSNLSK